MSSPTSDPTSDPTFDVSDGMFRDDKHSVLYPEGYIEIGLQRVHVYGNGNGRWTVYTDKHGTRVWESIGSDTLGQVFEETISHDAS